MSGIVNKVKNALHSDNTTGTTHTTGTHPTGTHTTGTHPGTAEGVAGHHTSRTANAADPRIDSDLDGSRNLGAAHNTHGTTHTTGNNYTPGTSHATGGLTGHSTQQPHTTGLTGAGHSTNSTAGPHQSNLLNKADPRVDSDLSKTQGHAHTAQGAHHNAGLTGATHTTGGGLTGNTAHNSHATTGQHTGVSGVGPHNSSLLNKADPTVDSDLSKSHHTTGTHNTTGGLTGTSHNTTHSSGLGGTHAGTGTHNTTGGLTGTSHNTTHTSGLGGTHVGNTHGNHTGTTGGISHSSNAGPHNSAVANKADPRVDSDLDGRGNRHGAATGGVLGASGSHATAGSGTAQNTAGPHNSDLLNKLDPRVDSDRDGSKTIGGNKTHA